MSPYIKIWQCLAFCLQDNGGRRLIDIDDFIARLWQIHLSVKEEGYVQVRYHQTEYSIVTLYDMNEDLKSENIRTSQLAYFGPTTCAT